MPHLHRNPFVPNEIPSDLDPKEKVYYCESTGEIFRNYEEYFERQITLDTEVWSCSISGKSNLTFDEAVESEESAREILKSVDKTLIRVILYLFSKATGRISVRTLVTEIHDAIKDSYFVDEVIIFQKKKFRIKSIKQKNQNQKDSDEENQSPEKITTIKPENLEYQIVPADKKDGESKIVDVDKIKRKENVQRIITYAIKTNAKQSETNKSWGITMRSNRRFKLDDFQWMDFFPGAEPVFETIIPKEIKQKKPKKPLAEVNKNDKVKREQKEKITEEEKRARAEKERAEKRKLLAAVMREWSKPKPDETLDDFNLFRLPSPDTVKTKIPSNILGDVFQLIEFQKNFSDAFGDMQYSTKLSKLTLKDMENMLFSNETDGLFCDILFFYIQAIRYSFESEKEEANAGSDCPYNFNFMKLDLGTGDGEDSSEEEGENGAIISDSPEATQESEAMDTSDKNDDADLSQNCSIINDEDIAWPMGAAHVGEDCVAFSTKAAKWSIRCLGRPVHELQVDEVTSTEVLRITILSMAAEMRSPIANYRRTYRGGWDNEEDSLVIALKEDKAIQIFRKMETTSIFDFKPEEKLFILSFLNDVCLSQNDGRQVMDDAEDEMKTCRRHLAEGYRNEKQRNRDFTAKVEHLENKVKEEGDKQPEPEPEKSDNYFRSRNQKQKTKEKPKMTAKEELEEALQDNLDLKSVHEDMIQRLNEKHLSNEVKIRSQCLGHDRFHRRYWLMSGCPGILVEVPKMSSLPEMADGSSWKAFEIPKQVPKPTMAKMKLENESDSEDDIPLAQVKKSGNSSMNDQPQPLLKPQKEGPEMEVDVMGEKPKENLDWSIRPTLCDEDTWFVYSTKEDIEKLINSLNERGEREKELKSSIMKYSSQYYNAVENTYDTGSKTTAHVTQVNGDAKEELSNTNLQILSVRDYLLDLEERIYNADFGDAFEDDNERKLWRNYWEKGSGNPDVIEIDFIDRLKSNGDLPPRVPLPIHLIPRKIPKEIQNLAAALILMGRAVRKKSFANKSDVLCRPLGNATKKKKKKNAESLGYLGKLMHGFKFWEASLMTVTSPSSLYLHCIHFDECINWDKSPENIRCVICKRKTDAETMLICDECDKAYHMACHKPKVKRIPDGDWFCAKCALKRKQTASPVKKRRRAVEEEEIDGVFISDRPRKRKKVNYAE